MSGIYGFVGAKRLRRRARKAAQAKIKLHGRKCARCGDYDGNIDFWGRPTRLSRHHKDGNVFNNERSNLEILCFKCHQAEHA